MLDQIDDKTQNKQRISTVIVYLITVLFAVGMLLIWCGTHKLLTEKLDTETTLKELCNAFTIAGALVLCLGGLFWVSDKGAFDGFAFSMKTFFAVHFSIIDKNPEHQGETYADYVQRKHKNDRRKKTYVFQIILGASMLIVALILLVVYKTKFNA